MEAMMEWDSDGMYDLRISLRRLTKKYWDVMGIRYGIGYDLIETSKWEHGMQCDGAKK